jgi:ferredoxin-NADP reductase
VLIAGGIGITPIISLLRTAADARDRRPFVLVYGSLRWEQVTFREQLEQLQRRLNLCVVHVLTDPPPRWTGETGLIDDTLLARHLPGDVAAADVFVCGPPPMLAAAFTALQCRGVETKHIHSEQFLTV